MPLRRLPVAVQPGVNRAEGIDIGSLPPTFGVTLQTAIRDAAKLVLQPARAPAQAEVPAPAVGPAGENWFWVSESTSYGGNHVPFDTLKQLQMVGVAHAVSDSALVSAATAERDAGFRIGVWAQYENYPSVGAYIAAIQRAADLVNADAIFLDVETSAKGAKGSDAYNVSAKIAAAARAAFPGIEIAVAPVRSGADFDFGAYTAQGMTVTVQTYGTNIATDLFDPVEVVRLVEAQGVKPDHISVLLSPYQLPAAIGALHGIGITHISVFTGQGLTPERIAASAPLIAAPAATGAAPAASQPPLASPPPGAVVATPTTTAGVASANPEAVAAAAEALGLTEPEKQALANVDATTTTTTVVKDQDIVDWTTFVPAPLLTPPADDPDPPDVLGDTWQSFVREGGSDDTRNLQGVTRLADAKLKEGRSIPKAVTQSLTGWRSQRAIPAHIWRGIEAAIIVYQKGIPYVWGGTNPNVGLDCSGYARYVLRQAGDNAIARVTYDQAKQGRAVAAGHLQPLDLCFFEPSKRGPGHVAIYIAAGWALHEPHTGLTAQWLNIDGGWKPYETRRYFADIHPPAHPGPPTKPGPPTPIPATKPPSPRAPKPPAKPTEAWRLLRHRLTDVWPQVGRNARARGDALLDAVRSPQR